MSDPLPVVYLARHGETEWSRTGQHTGLTDLPLTEHGERNALLLGERLRELEISRVSTSPLQRARRTCELCGFSSMAEVDPDLVEWDYGEYEGKTGAEIRVRHPGWDVFVDGCPGGESPQQVAARADRVVRRLRTHSENTLVFTSGHFIRVLAARWVGSDPGLLGRKFLLDTASLSALGYDRDLSRPIIALWNQRSVAPRPSR